MLICHGKNSLEFYIFYFQGKSLETNESDSAYVLQSLKSYMSNLRMCNAVINKILFEEFFYYANKGRDQLDATNDDLLAINYSSTCFGCL